MSCRGTRVHLMARRPVGNQGKFLCTYHTHTNAIHTGNWVVLSLKGSPVSYRDCSCSPTNWLCTPSSDQVFLNIPPQEEPASSHTFQGQGSCPYSKEPAWFLDIWDSSYILELNYMKPASNVSTHCPGPTNTLEEDGRKMSPGAVKARV